MNRYKTRRYWGYSSDTKPKAQLGDRYLEIDTQNEYFLGDYNNWLLIGAESGTSDASSIDSSNSMRWVYGSTSSNGKFSINVNSLSINDTDTWISSIDDYLIESRADMIVSKLNLESINTNNWWGVLKTSIDTQSYAILQIRSASDTSVINTYSISTIINNSGANRWELELTPINNSFNYTNNAEYSISWTFNSDIKKRILNIPTPNLSLIGGDQSVEIQYVIGTASYGTFSLSSYPIINTGDITSELLDNYPTYVEVVFFKKSVISNEGYTRRKSGYIVPSPWYIDDYGDVYKPDDIVWPSNFESRNGEHRIGDFQLKISRPNHYRVRNVNERINVYEYLNARFKSSSINYRHLSGDIQDVECIIPFTTRSSYHMTRRYSYAPAYTPLYFAFRYVCWDKDANNGNGQIISGPLTRTIKMTNSNFPFINDINAGNSHCLPCAEINYQYDKHLFRCWFEKVS